MVQPGSWTFPWDACRPPLIVSTQMTPFVLGLVREHRRSGDIADGIDPGTFVRRSRR